MEKINRFYADLHNHTTASDGLLSPTELIEYASIKGLKAVAITDHDITAGIREAVEAGERLGIEVIPGIELNTQVDKKEVHILGYYIKEGLSWFEETLEKIRNARLIRAEKMVENLQQIYKLDISIEEVQKKAGVDGVVARPHIARVLIDKGIVSDITEAFDKFIGVDSPAYVERYKLTPEEGIDMIKKAGGVPVLAHPGLLYDDPFVELIISKGVLGIEAFHSKHVGMQSNFYEKLGISHGLIVTGGSDCHGELIDGLPIIGDVKVPYWVVESLKSASKKIRESYTAS